MPKKKFNISSRFYAIQYMNVAECGSETDTRTEASAALCTASRSNNDIADLTHGDVQHWQLRCSTALCGKNKEVSYRKRIARQHSSSPIDMNVRNEVTFLSLVG